MTSSTPSATPEPGSADPVTGMAEEAVLRERMQRIGRKLLVLSGKGGVGKSTVAVNLAATLAQRGRRVGLLDVDVHGPSVPTLLRVPNPQVKAQGEQMTPVLVGRDLKVMSVGFLTRSGSDPVIWRGPRKFHAIRQFLRDVVWGELDHLVVDCPPGTGDEPLAVAQLVGDHAFGVLVTTPQDVAIADVRRCVNFCKAAGLPIAGIIENMSGFVCPHCGKTSDLFKSGGGERLAREAEVPVLGRIPLDPGIVRSGDEGTPYAGLVSKTPAARSLQLIVDRLTEGASS